MNAMRICSVCSKPLAANAPQGLCPECLLKAGLGTGVDIGPDSQSQAEGGKLPFVAPTPDELAKPFPQLEILSFIGQGGMGAVYKARQKALDRVVALKILPPGIGGDPSFAQRFAREAKALAKLNHPGIVTLYEFGQADGLFFFLMEFVDGVNLRHLLEVERISPREALAIVPQICDALQYAHDQGIVHRDIKPENILLDRQGRVKVADFGLAKLVGTEGEPSAAGGMAVGSAVLTEAGKVMGTPQYMAPEQREHPTEVDHRADIYSLGVVFYQMLTGEMPGKPIEPPSRKVQVDVRIDEIVLRALEKTPELRYQTAADLRTQIETVVNGAGTAGPANRTDNSAPRRLNVGTSLVTTPEQLGTFDGQFFLYRRKSQMLLEDRQLTFARGGTTTVIPLAAIRDLSIGHYPRTMHPARLDFISVTYDEGGQTKRLFFSPYESWFGLPSHFNQFVAEWFNAIRAADVAATGRAPGNTPAEQLGVPSGSTAIYALLLGPAVLAGTFLLAGVLMGLYQFKGDAGTHSFLGGWWVIILGVLGVGFLALALRRLFGGSRKPAVVTPPAGTWKVAAIVVAGLLLIPAVLLGVWFLTGRSEDSGSTPAPTSAFGPEITQVLGAVEGNTTHWLDLDTGRQMSLSVPDDETAKLALFRTNGLDLMGIVTKKEIGVACREMVVRQVAGSRWDRATAQEIVSETGSAPVGSGADDVAVITTSPRRKATVFFRTREGGHGILQITGRSENPLGVKIRYKLLQAPSTPAGKLQDGPTEKMPPPTVQTPSAGGSGMFGGMGGPGENELPGGGHSGRGPEPLRLKLQQAQAEFARAKQSYDAGIATQSEVQKAQFARDVAAAEMEGDASGVLRLKLQRAHEELLLVETRFKAGLATQAEFEKAKAARDTAQAELGMVAEPPTLRFLAWQDENPSWRDWKAWRPNGGRADPAEEQGLLLHHPPTRIDLSATREGRGARVLFVWFSHPHIERRSYAEMTMADSTGRTISPCLDGYGGGVYPAKASEGELGWVVRWFAPAQDATLPSTVNLTLRYSLGDWQFPVIVTREMFGGTMDTEWGNIPGAGETLDGKAFVSLVRNTAKGRDLQVDFAAEMTDGRLIEPSGTRESGPPEMRHGRFQFDAPLGQIKEFRLRTCPIRTVEYRNVSLQAGGGGVVEGKGWLRLGPEIERNRRGDNARCSVQRVSVCERNG